jgi:3-phosphoshikimate 1-carboxyvinyltransferase
MKVTIQPSILKGNIQAPASKSSMQRACAAALLRNGASNIYNPGHSNDDKAALGIIETLGAKPESRGEVISIKSTGKVLPTHQKGKVKVNCGESGLSIRMFTPIIALSEVEVEIEGEGSLRDRPMDFFDEVLPQLGVKTRSKEGKLPLIIQGPLRPKNIEINGSLSSQFLTGRLMAYGASLANARGGTAVSIAVSNLKSKPYIDLTLEVMKRFGMNVPENRDYGEFIFHPGLHHVQPSVVDYTVEGDWSGGAFLLVAGAISGAITVRGLDQMSSQADKAVLEALMSANASVAMEAKGIKIRAAGMNGFEFDATHCPDLFPPLVALAAYCGGETKIKGISRLTYKESNRALTLKEEFGKMGLGIDLAGDIMIIHGGRGLIGAAVHSRHDHRIAMALAVAALKADGQTVIEEAQAVKKSYPDFFHDLKAIGATLSLPFQLIK